MPDTAGLADYAFELADRLVADYGDDWIMGELLMVAEVRLPDGSVRVEILASETRTYVVSAILNRALDIMERCEDEEMGTDPAGD